MTVRWLPALALAAVVPRPASSQTGNAGESTFGDGDDALPGGAHLAVAGPLAPGLALALGGGYGIRGATFADDDRHHRADLALAASYRVAPWLALAARVAGRYDAHTGETRDD